jgi:hypothetical protein
MERTAFSGPAGEIHRTLDDLAALVRAGDVTYYDVSAGTFGLDERSGPFCRSRIAVGADDRRSFSGRR